MTEASCSEASVIFDHKDWEEEEAVARAEEEGGCAGDLEAPGASFSSPPEEESKGT